MCAVLYVPRCVGKVCRLPQLATKSLARIAEVPSARLVGPPFCGPRVEQPFIRYFLVRDGNVWTSSRIGAASIEIGGGRYFHILWIVVFVFLSKKMFV